MLNLFLRFPDLYDLEKFPTDLIDISLQLIISRFAGFQVITDRFEEPLLTDHLAENWQCRLFNKRTYSIL